MYAFKSMCPLHFNMAGGGRGVKAILNEVSLPAKCEHMIRSLSCTNSFAAQAELRKCRFPRSCLAAATIFPSQNG